MKVWVLTMATREGVDATLFATEQDAYDALFDWVEDWWERELGHTGIEKPDDPRERIAAYFCHVDAEDYNVQHLDLPGT